MRRSLLYFAVFALIGSVVEVATLQGTFDRTFDVKPGASFALDNTNGHIVVRSWDEPRVRVQALKRVGSRDAGEAKKAFDALAIVPTASAGSLRIETKFPRRNESLFDWIAGTSVTMNVDYDLTVPRSMNVQIDNTNGAIDISDVHGSIRVSNTNGHIECVRCAGDIEAETTNGRIRAELAEVNRGKPIRLESTNGGLTVTLPKSMGARIDASTTNGSVRTDLPVSTTELRHNALRGTINGGGAELRLRTTNGSISIEAH